MKLTQPVYWIEGDGIGPEVWQAARPAIDSAVRAAYGPNRELQWHELLAGAKAIAATGSPLPPETLHTLATAHTAIKGPLETPVGSGIRSLNVALRQTLDLYACIRPIHHLPGLETPIKHPERVNLTVFRENTEDVYAGIEYKAQSSEAKKLIAFLNEEFNVSLPDDAAIGIKPMTEKNSKRLIRKAINFAIAHKLPSVTLVHKGNIMKYTEGAFRQWGYDLAAEEFTQETSSDDTSGKIVINDRIADAMFQEALLHPEKYSVLATPNLNGDYLSDAIAAQVGGLGVAPGVNMSDSLAFFEATHGTAPSIAHKDLANPSSLILCGAMLLEHIGWNEAAHTLRKAITSLIKKKLVTPDLATQVENAVVVGCKKFGESVIREIEAI